MRKKSYNHAGFTFIELLISFAILALVVGRIVAVFYAVETTWNVDMALLHLSQQSRIAMDGMMREVRGGRNVNITNNGTTIDFNVTDGTNISSIQYYLDNTTDRIIRTVEPANLTQVLISGITDLEFNLSDDEVVSIEIEAETTVRGRNYNVSLSEQVRLRN